MTYALRQDEIEVIRRLRFEEGRTQAEVAAMLGRHRDTICRHAPGRLGQVPVAPIAEAFQRSGLTAGQVCHVLGWSRPRRGYPNGKPDVSRLTRALGLAPQCDYRGRYTVWAQRIRIDLAIQIIRAIGLDPVDFDL